MKTKVRFYKQDNIWYADVPNHTLEENEMVFGSDMALELLANGKDEVTLEIADEPIVDYTTHFHIKEHDDDGAFYQVCGDADNLNEIWVCNVTHDVLGEHPEDIYIKYIEKNED